MKIISKSIIYKSILYLLTISAILLIIIKITNEDFEKKYSKNSKQLLTLCEYLDCDEFQKYNIIRIDIFDSQVKMECSQKNNLSGGYINTVYTIKEEKIVECLKILSKQRFIRILKENDYIFFQTKGTFNRSEGLIYSPLGEPDLSNNNSIYSFVEKLKAKHWYYCKEKYD